MQDIVRHLCFSDLTMADLLKFPLIKIPYLIAFWAGAGKSQSSGLSSFTHLS